MTTIHHQLQIDAPVSRVYEALATAEAISKWWDEQTARQTPEGVVLDGRHGWISGRPATTSVVRSSNQAWEDVLKNLSRVVSDRVPNTHCFSPGPG
jgi:hypothetical protein